MLHLVSCGGSTATSAKAADDCPKREVKKNLIRPEEVSFHALSSGESRRRGRRSAVGATEEEAASFVGARKRGERFKTSPRIWLGGRSRR
jgi:hypothetical protein